VASLYRDDLIESLINIKDVLACLAIEGEILKEDNELSHLLSKKDQLTVT
jgi:hypothetical protein